MESRRRGDALDGMRARYNLVPEVRNLTSQVTTPGGDRAVTGKWEQDHELITFRLTSLDRFFVWYSIIGTLVVIAFFAAMTTFEGIWIGGMPKSAFYLVVVGIVDAVVGVGGYFAYKAYYDRLVEQGK